MLSFTITGERIPEAGRSLAETRGPRRGGGPHLLRWSYALLLIKFRRLLRLNLQAQTFLKSLVLKHQRGAEPKVVRLPQVLQHAGPDGNRGDALGHGLHEAVEGAGLTVPLHLVAAAAQERADLTGQSLKPKNTSSLHSKYGLTLTQRLTAFWRTHGQSR